MSEFLQEPWAKFKSPATLREKGFTHPGRIQHNLPEANGPARPLIHVFLDIIIKGNNS
jgi:hypothetical protein